MHMGALPPGCRPLRPAGVCVCCALSCLHFQVELIPAGAKEAQGLEEPALSTTKSWGMEY